MRPCPTASCCIQDIHRACLGLPGVRRPCPTASCSLQTSIMQASVKTIYFAPSRPGRAEICCPQIVVPTLSIHSSHMSSMNYSRLQNCTSVFQKIVLVIDLNKFLD
jgi:hypothetical protein